MEDRRREDRFDIAEDYRDYFEFRLLSGRDNVLLHLLEFSRHGLKFISPLDLSRQASIRCSLSAPRILSGKSISLTLSVRHCSLGDGQFIVGCQIKEVSDETWFRVFEKIHAFVAERAGRVY